MDSKWDDEEYFHAEAADARDELFEQNHFPICNKCIHEIIVLISNKNNPHCKLKQDTQKAIDENSCKHFKDDGDV